MHFRIPGRRRCEQPADAPFGGALGIDSAVYEPLNCPTLFRSPNFDVDYHATPDSKAPPSRHNSSAYSE